ncbi:ankyrin repeat-containing domain protein [Pelagophyceae sp. CCMP2097]|nr:ankyrin repeat-containing domain protein [Pelagophyceae sp. CCMP2097]
MGDVPREMDGRSVARGSRNSRDATPLPQVYAEPVVERVISDSPGLEDVDAELTPETAHAAKEAFQSRDEKGAGRLDVSMLQPLFEAVGVKLDNEQWQRIVVEGRSLPDDLDLADWLRLFASVYAPASHYGAKLRTAAGRGDVCKVRDFVVRGCDPSGVDGLGFSLLHVAAQAGRLECLDLGMDLIAKATGFKVDLNVRDKAGWTPLHCASAGGHANMVDRLISAGAEFKTSATAEGRTALHWACAKGRLDVVKLLLQKGARQDSRDGAGHTALHLAAMHGHLLLCVHLVKLDDGPLKMQNSIGKTPRDYQDLVFWLKIRDKSPR